MKLFLTLLSCVALVAAAEVKLGRPFEIKNPLTVGEAFANSSESAGKTVQVKGKVTEVCQSMGCWMSLTDDNGHFLRIQVGHDGAIVFKPSAIGKMAVAEGKLSREELSRDELVAAARHEAQDAGRSFDASTVKTGKVVIEIAGTGIVILE